MLLSNLSLFLKITEKGSLTAAAREVGLSVTTVSDRLAALEAHYGVVLLNRTTRALSLTDEGRALIEGAKRVLGEVGDLDARIRQGASALSGMIRVSAPSDLGRNIVSREIDRFLIENPAVSIELQLSDGYTDVVGNGIDIALRFGSITDSSLRVRSLGIKRRILCASPEYLTRHPEPKTPDDLQQHNCLVMRFGTTLDNHWHFGHGKTARQISVQGNRIANDGALVRRWCIEGAGIAMKSETDATEDIKAGRLVELLPEFAAPGRPLQILFPPSRAQPLRVNAFARRLTEALI